ncbi:T9SS type A sorting domain-containing protein [Epilithonimonas arachidiradicis]|uniref:Peptidase n=1 Tax=Epilithonimonas arachidiradicis TaxID=1617282 RepID=A0A420DBB6_9FLAO|nr:T9SS type A sorting domain-containing protein [Epilithonimonas arachidiradicis]RKE88868.1 putative secreted protein (Por secretion system target) [Epilithonimonas arachidiradicis]GGG54455.1 peptidase [Epilithonimonas arachidiradicis]
MNLKINFLVASFALTFSTMYGQTTTLESKARDWISKNSNKIGTTSKDNFEFQSSRKSLSGETLRFQQTINGIPVYEGDIAIHFNKQGEVTYGTEIAVSKQLKQVDTTPTFNKSDAFETAKIAAEIKGEITHQENDLYVFLTEGGQTRLVHRVIINSYETSGDWEIMVDAHSGDVLRILDIANYHHDDNRKKKSKQKPAEMKAAGTAYIFDPDPLSRAHVAYGGDYVDNNDATNASLDAARSLVTLPDITLSNGVYSLKSKYVQIADFEAPSTGLFTQSSPDFLFNRNEQGFEAVNAFYHIDRSLAYINETLGIVCKSTLNGGVIMVDPHGLNGDDNSHFIPSSQRLAFGEGCVDDAEDADVVLHELGHAIHHWVTGLKSSSAQGLGEGSGDYWAMSYSRSLNQWAKAEPQYNWMFSWDGHNECWAGRVTNYAPKYPTSTINNSSYIHINGQIWATSLMRIYDRIGKEKTDRIFLEGLAMTNSSGNQQTAAVAVRQASIDMLGTYGFTCDDVNIITEELTTSGYTLPAYQCTSLAVSDLAKNSVSVYPNPVTEKLTVSMNFKKAETAEIYSLEGRKISETNINSNNNVINVSTLSKGVYLLKIKGTDIAQKFIKN